MTKLIKTVDEMKHVLTANALPVGLIPTMGALHDGHISLIKSARDENKTVIVYIFVNPLQFGPNEDYKVYPRELDEDLKKCEEHGVDYVFAPTVEEIYPDIVEVANEMLDVPAELKNILCGKTRKSHFNGVATVIKRFFEIVNPQNVYFGQKDLQQVYVIKWLIDKFNFDITLRECSIVRETNGLAMSSRNKYLDAKQMEMAPHLYKSLKMARENVKSGMFTPQKAILESLIYLSKFSEIKTEYFEAKDKKNLKDLGKKQTKDFYFLVAAKLGNVRLIDNIEV